MKFNLIKLKLVFPASSLLELSTGNKILKKIVTIFLNFLEKRFQGRLLLEAPENLIKLNPDLWPAIITSEKIKTLGPFVSKRFLPLEDEPFLYKYSTKINGQQFGGGAHFISEETALWRSLAEGIERYLWRTSEDFYQGKIVYATYENLGQKVLDIFSLAGFSEKDKEKNKTLFFNKSSCLGWIKASSLLKKEMVYCPIQLLSYHYSELKVRKPENQQGGEPMLRWPVSTGLATGRSIQEAITKGILEIVERDAYMITYLNKLSPPRIDLEHLAEKDEDINKILKNFRRCHLKVTLLRIPTDFPVFIIMALITDDLKGTPALTVGASADFNIKSCLLDALSESLSTRLSLRKNPALFKEPPDPKKITRESRPFYWSRSENLPKIDFLFKGAIEKIELPVETKFFNLSTEEENERLKIFYSKKLEDLKEALRQFDYEGCYLQIAPKEINQAGLYCAVTVIPKLQPMHLNESLPYFSGQRLKEVPIKLGYQPAKKINTEPQPLP